MFNLISLPIQTQVEEPSIHMPLELKKPCGKIGFDVFSTPVLKQGNKKPKSKYKKSQILQIILMCEKWVIQEHGLGRNNSET